MAEKQSSPVRPIVVPPENEDFLDSLQYGEVIGQGAYGRVFIGIDPSNRQQFALKKIRVDRLDQPKFELFQEEIKNMNNMKHPSLLKLHTTMISTSYVIMVMPLMSNRSCDRIITEAYPTGLPEAGVGCIIKDVLNAISYLHQSNIVHRSIKASHILISASGAAVLTGFRFMIQIPPNKKRITTCNNTLNQMTNYVNWMAPEVLMQDTHGIGLNSDMYSVGITICEMANGVVPYSDVSPAGILVKKVEEASPKLWDKNFLPSQNGGHGSGAHAVPGGILRHPEDQPYKGKLFSPNIHKFVSVCLISEPETRISCEAAQKMKFVTTYAREGPSETLRNLNLMLPPLKFRPPPAEGASQPDSQSSQESHEDWQF